MKIGGIKDVEESEDGGFYFFLSFFLSVGHAHHSIYSRPAIWKRPGVVERLFAALSFGEGAEAAAGDEGMNEAVGDV